MAQAGQDLEKNVLPQVYIFSLSVGSKTRAIPQSPAFRVPSEMQVLISNRYIYYIDDNIDYNKDYNRDYNIDRL